MTVQLDDALWAPLRKALPRFAPTWQRYTRYSHDPANGSANINELARYLFLVLDSCEPRPDLPRFFQAIERLLKAKPEAMQLISVSFFEDLFYLADKKYFDLRGVYKLLAGPLSKKAWDAAAGWTNPEARWHGQRGFVSIVSYPPVRGSLTILPLPDSKSVPGPIRMPAVLYRGTIRKGWFVRYRLSRYSHSCFRVDGIRQVKDGGSNSLYLLEFHARSEREQHHLSILTMGEDAKVLLVYASPPRSR